MWSPSLSHRASNSQLAFHNRILSSYYEWRLARSSLPNQGEDEPRPHTEESLYKLFWAAQNEAGRRPYSYYLYGHGDALYQVEDGRKVALHFCRHYLKSPCKTEQRTDDDNEKVRSFFFRRCKCNIYNSPPVGRLHLTLVHLRLVVWLILYSDAWCCLSGRWGADGMFLINKVVFCQSLDSNRRTPGGSISGSSMLLPNELIFVSGILPLCKERFDWSQQKFHRWNREGISNQTFGIFFFCIERWLQTRHGTVRR